MGLKRLLGIISVIIIVVFSMMLTTSYAWYSFDNASTVYEGVTNNNDILVSYRHGEYISTSIAVPISSSDVDRYSEKNNFAIDVKNENKDVDIAVRISLVDVSIDTALKNSNFKIKLYNNSSIIGNINGANINTGTNINLATITLQNNVTNNFELRIYILDDGTNQTSMMDKSFQGKIQVDVVSRLKTDMEDYEAADIYISSIYVDGVLQDYIPTSGYYDMTSSCVKGSNLTWEPLSKTITYNSGSYIQDKCSLNFTSSTDYPLLSDMEVGSYVKYVGTNGCDGKACEGYNANYKNETSRGYCYNNGSEFLVNGWRIGYIKNGSVHLVSAGAPECVSTYVERSSSSTTNKTMGAYYYASGYTFDDFTGKYILTGVTSSTIAWDGNSESILKNTPYTCATTSTSCTTMYKVDSIYSTTQAKVYTYYNFEQETGIPAQLKNFNNTALKYCNNKYAYGGVCNGDSAWAMNKDDFYEITGKVMALQVFSNKDNGLIDNGGFYWFASESSSGFAFMWNAPTRIISSNVASERNYGVRPVLNLSSLVVVTGGAGTYKDPYVIDIKK